MNIYIILKRVIWRLKIYNLFREIFKFREDKSNNEFHQILKCFHKTPKFEFFAKQIIYFESPMALRWLIPFKKIFQTDQHLPLALFSTTLESRTFYLETLMEMSTWIWLTHLFCRICKQTILTSIWHDGFRMMLPTPADYWSKQVVTVIPTADSSTW